MIMREQANINGAVYLTMLTVFSEDVNSHASILLLNNYSELMFNA